MTASTNGEKVCHSAVLVYSSGTKCWALPDTGATGSYASAYLSDLLKLKLKTALKRRIQTIIGTQTKNINVYDIKVSIVMGDYWMPRLGRLAERFVMHCAACKRFQAVAMVCPPPGLSPRSRTEGIPPFLRSSMSTTQDHCCTEHRTRKNKRHIYCFTHSALPERFTWNPRDG